MKLTLLVLCVLGVSLAESARVRFSEDVELWTQWKSNFNKKYESEVEEITRFRIWAEHLKLVESHNAAFALGAKTFDLEMNEFADLSSEEFVAQRNGYVKQDMAAVSPRSSMYIPTGVSLPTSQNWTSQGYVTPVKNQGQCGSCWAFSTTGSLEGQHFNATGNLVSLSEQQLVDCDTRCYGCGGGNVQLGFQYIISNKGSDLESAYPYTARNGNCHADGEPIGATLKAFVNLPKGSESALEEASATLGPISVAIDASHYSFQLYKSGVYYESECSTTRLDHAVLVAGYGQESGADYWLVKNSWGANWGLDGYILMARNRNNNCGIATDATYPVV